MNVSAPMVLKKISFTASISIFSKKFSLRITSTDSNLGVLNIDRLLIRLTPVDAIDSFVAQALKVTVNREHSLRAAQYATAQVKSLKSAKRKKFL